MNSVEHNTAPFPSKPISKKLKFETQTIQPANLHDLPPNDHNSSQVQNIQAQRFKFNFQNVKSGTTKIQAPSLSKEKTYEFIRNKF